MPLDVFDWAVAAHRVHHRLPVLDETPTRGQLHATIALRERMYALFASVLVGDTLDDQRWMLDRFAAAARASALARTDAGFALEWTGSDVASLQHALVGEALQLLCSPAIDRVGACQGCGWLFLDTSRAGARRWCAMSMCGSRHKMRRYHQRRHAPARQ